MPAGRARRPESGFEFYRALAGTASPVNCSPSPLPAGLWEVALWSRLVKSKGALTSRRRTASRGTRCAVRRVGALVARRSPRGAGTARAPPCVGETVSIFLNTPAPERRAGKGNGVGRGRPRPLPRGGRENLAALCRRSRWRGGIKAAERTSLQTQNPFLGPLQSGESILLPAVHRYVGW